MPQKQLSVEGVSAEEEILKEVNNELSDNGNRIWTNISLPEDTQPSFLFICNSCCTLKQVLSTFELT